MYKIAVFYLLHGKAVTGGQIYELDLFEILKKTEGIDIHMLTAPPAYSKLKKITTPLRSLKMLQKLETYDLVIFNSSKAHYFLPLLFALRRKGIPTMVIHHHFAYLEMAGVKREIFRRAERLFLRSATHVLTPSPYIAEELRQHYGVSPLVLEIPFDTDVHIDSIHPIAGKLLYIGTTEARKGLIYLIDAMALLKRKGIKVSLDIVGKCIDEGYRDKLLEKIEKVGIENVTFHGFVEKQVMESLKSTSDIFVFPSLLEGFGMALNEAMAYGMPVVCFNNSAMPYSVKDGVNGYLVENGSAEGLASKIADIVTDRNLRRSLSDGATAWAKKLPDRKVFILKAQELFGKLQNKKKYTYRENLLNDFHP